MHAIMVATCKPQSLPALLESHPPALFSAIKSPPSLQPAVSKNSNKQNKSEAWKYYFVKDLLSHRPLKQKHRLRQCGRIAVCVLGALAAAVFMTASLEWCLEYYEQGQGLLQQQEQASRAEYLQRYRDLLAPMQSYYEQMDSRLGGVQRTAQREFGAVSGSVARGDGVGVSGGASVRPRVRVRVQVGLQVPRFVSNGELEGRVAGLRRAVAASGDVGWRPTIVFVCVFLGVLGGLSYVSREQSRYFRGVLEHAVSYWPAYKDCIPEDLHGEFERLRVVCDGGGVSEGEAREVVIFFDRVCCGRSGE